MYSIKRGTKFQSTPSAWRETCHFYHSFLIILYFNPLPPHGGRRTECAAIRQKELHFNPLPPHGGRLEMFPTIFSFISHFNPLPPHGGRQAQKQSKADSAAFQSTPSAWRETRSCASCRGGKVFQSTPSAWRETYDIGTDDCYILCISIHSLRMEGDAACVYHAWRTGKISIHSLRMEGDLSVRFILTLLLISIHSLRMEGDRRRISIDGNLRNFNPLPPHGGRRRQSEKYKKIANFNPLPPHGGRLGIPL